MFRLIRNAEKCRYELRWPAGLAGALLSLGLLCPPGSAASAPLPVMRLASLDWLPYVSPGLEGEGWSSFVAGMAARQAGFRTQIDYFPWTRAMQLGSRDPRYAGYFPAYYTEERSRQCHFSAPIGSSTVGLAFLKSRPLHWDTLQDLSRLRIGVVAGFSNGPEFDRWARAGKLSLDPSPNDMLNLRKLLAHRVDAVVIDRLVMRYLLLAEHSLAPEGERFAFHEKPLAELPMHVCFQRSPEGQAMQRAFDGAMHALQLQKLEADYFRRLEGK